MKICTFIGHKDAPSDIKPMLEDAIRDLILNRGVKQFYVGTHGTFDSMAKDVLKQFVKKYPRVNYNVVLAYLPSKADEYNDYSDTNYDKKHPVEKIPRGVITNYELLAICKLKFARYFYCVKSICLSLHSNAI